LDLGCGEGFFLYFASKAGYSNLHGVEISPQQVEIAKQYCQEANIVEGDIMNYLDSTALSFDLIVLDNVLEHFDKDNVFIILEAIHKKLNTNGKIFISVPNAGSPWGVPIAFTDFTHEVYFDPMSLRQVLMASGYEDVRVKGAGPIPVDFLPLVRSCFYYPIRTITLFFMYLMAGGSIRNRTTHAADPGLEAVASKH
jgi:SAM-dependent methyltransferase